MADKKLFTGKYAVVNPTRLSGSVTLGHMGQEVELSNAFSASKPAENGMLLTVDRKTCKAGLPAATTDEVYLHASVLKGYQGEGENELALVPNTFLPRLFKLVKDDLFETNAVIYSATDFADVAAIKAAIVAGTVYGIADTTGYIRLTKTAPTDEVVVLEALRVIQLPNYEDGIEFEVKKGL